MCLWVLERKEEFGRLESGWAGAEPGGGVSLFDNSLLWCSYKSTCLHFSVKLTLKLVLSNLSNFSLPHKNPYQIISTVARHWLRLLSKGGQQRVGRIVPAKQVSNIGSTRLVSKRIAIITTWLLCASQVWKAPCLPEIYSQLKCMGQDQKLQNEQNCWKFHIQNGRVLHNRNRWKTCQKIKTLWNLTAVWLKKTMCSLWPICVMNSTKISEKWQG